VPQLWELGVQPLTILEKTKKSTKMHRILAELGRRNR
jgi:hypothetical protein